MGSKSITYYFNGIFDKIGRKLKPRYSRREVVLFRYTNALGDALMLTTMAREVKKRNPSAYIKVVTGLPDIFLNNNDINEVIHETDAKIRRLGRYLMRYEHRFPWETHILNYCKECVDIKDEIELQTYIHPSGEDISYANQIVQDTKKPIILINRKAGPRTDKKNWPDSFWNNLITILSSEYTIIEIGTLMSDQIMIPNDGYINLVGKTSIHQTAALMMAADFLICPVTGLLHLAAACNLKTLCILGGSEPQIGTQYRNTFYLTNRPACSDCYEQGPCTNDFICLYNISPESVYYEVRKLCPVL